MSKKKQKQKKKLDWMFSFQWTECGRFPQELLFIHKFSLSVIDTCTAPMVPFPSPYNVIWRRNRCALTVRHREPWWEMWLPCGVSYNLLSLVFWFLLLANPPHSGRREMRERAFPPHYTESSFREDKCPAHLAVSSSHIKQGTHCVSNYWLSATDWKLKSSFP